MILRTTTAPWSGPTTAVVDSTIGSATAVVHAIVVHAGGERLHGSAACRG